MRPTRSIPAIVRTPRLVLRRQRPEDAQLIRDAVDSSLAHLRASVAWAQAEPTSLPDTAKRLARSAASFDNGKAWTFSIFDAPETRVLGGAGIEPAESALTALVGPHALETGYWLRADATGHGYATEATGALVELAFEHVEARRVVICHDPANTPSSGIPRRLGFKCLGTIPNDALPGRQAADGTVRSGTMVWVLEAPASTSH